MWIMFVVLFIIAFIMAWRSMKDFHLPEEISKLINSRKIRGSIVFFKDKKVEHYSSKSSSSSSTSIR